VPLLFDPVFADYVQRYGAGGLKAEPAGRLRAAGAAVLVHHRVRADPHSREGLRAYGAGILSSAGELRYAVHQPRAAARAAALERTMRTRYKIDSFQQTYFVIDSFEQLFDMTAPDFAPVYERVKALPELAADEAVPGEMAIAA
jgi:phenylalanine-4-hydroxylase